MDNLAFASGETLLHVQISSLAGTSAGLEVHSASTVSELREKVEEALGVPRERQRLVVGSRHLISGADGCATMHDLGIADGADITVLTAFEAVPMAWPDQFSMSWVTSRKRVEGGRGYHSSGFTIDYRINANLNTNRIAVEMWRKNDHDELAFDTQAGLLTGTRQHWMAGNTDFREDLLFRKPLRELLEGWQARAEVIREPTERFWRLPSEVADAAAENQSAESSGDTLHFEWRTRETALKDARPQRRGKSSGWFQAPSEDCVELKVDASLPFACLARVLIDEEGRPVRVAMVKNPCPSHDWVEEYDVVIMDTSDGEAGQTSSPSE